MSLAPAHDQVVDLALELLEAETRSGRWALRPCESGTDRELAEVRARWAYSTAKAYLEALEDLRPVRDGGRPRPPPTSAPGGSAGPYAPPATRGEGGALP